MTAPSTFPKMFADLEKRVRRQEQRRPFANSGVHISGPGIIDSDNYVPGVSGFRLAETPEFNDLALRGGLIGNDSLSQPVVPGVARESATGFALTTTISALATLPVTVPSGCTSLLATVNGRMYAVNTRTTGGSDGTGGDALYVLVSLGSQSSVATPTGISGNGGFATTTAAESFVLTGLTPGSTLTLAAYGASGYANLPAHPDNRASFAATLMWLR